MPPIFFSENVPASYQRFLEHLEYKGIPNYHSTVEEFANTRYMEGIHIFPIEDTVEHIANSVEELLTITLF